jgi:hypothetical protein
MKVYSWTASAGTVCTSGLPADSAGLVAGFLIKGPFMDTTTTTLAPIILDLGKKKKRAIKSLKRGRGRLMDEVEQTLAEVRAGLGADGSNKELVPIVMIYQRKRKRRKGLGSLF